eukprot:scaffold54395_cov21-Tisochrysis_lutea.AAC.1
MVASCLFLHCLNVHHNAYLSSHMTEALLAYFLLFPDARTPQKLVQLVLEYCDRMSLRDALDADPKG